MRQNSRDDRPILSPEEQERYDRALINSIFENDPEETVRLYEAGANIDAKVNIRDEKGRPWTTNALIVAVLNGSMESIKTIFQLKPNVNQKDSHGCAAIHYAVMLPDDASVLAMLLEAGADVNLRGALGSTPLHCLVDRNEDMIKLQYLLAGGADLSLTNEGHKTPLELATAQQKPFMASALQTIEEGGKRPTFGELKEKFGFEVKPYLRKMRMEEAPGPLIETPAFRKLTQGQDPKDRIRFN